MEFRRFKIIIYRLLHNSEKKIILIISQGDGHNIESCQDDKHDHGFVKGMGHVPVVSGGS